MWTLMQQVWLLLNTQQESLVTDDVSLGGSHTVQQCTIPQFAGITWQTGDAIYFMEFSSNTTPNGDGFCSTFMSITSIVTGS